METMREKKKLVYSIPEVSMLLGISRTKAYDLTHQEGFPKIELGRRVVVPCKEFEEWLSSQVQRD